MSDNWLRYVPTDPLYQPTAEQARVAEALLSEFLPEAGKIQSEFTNHPAFVDPGANWSGVHCPSCGTDAGSWWQDAMSSAAERNFSSLEVRSPCCGNTISLNSMRYVWPAAFGRYVLEAMNPNEKGLPQERLALLASALGCGLREVAVHI